MAKCAECGFLSLRRQDMQLVEADELFRKNLQPIGIKAFNVNPLCFMREIDIQKLLTEQEGDSRDNKLRSILEQERKCKNYTDWQQGFTPKEHREMMDRERMKKMEDERRRNDRKWHWIELGALVLGAGLFTLLGALIS